MKFLLPRKLYYEKLAGTGWVGLDYNFKSKITTVLCAGLNFWETLIHLWRR